MEPVYEVHGLCKYYGKKAALDGVDFTVEPGKLVGLLGPNGSGKTTLIKISAGLLTADSGTVCIDKAPVGVYTKAITSYLPDRMALPTEFTAADAVSLYTDFFADFDHTKANAMLADLHLNQHDRIGAMSKGTQEKMQLCLTMSTLPPSSSAASCGRCSAFSTLESAVRSPSRHWTATAFPLPA